MLKSRRTLPILAGVLACGLVLGARFASSTKPARLLALPGSRRAARRPRPPDAPLRYDVRADGGSPIPCKLTLFGVPGVSWDPRFTKDDVARAEGAAYVAYNRVLSRTGAGVVRLPAGTYDVYVSHGPEWDIDTQRIVVDAAGGTLRATLRHVAPTPGWLSADLHVHAAGSPDSRVPMEARVHEFIAEGVDMIVSADHNVASDYAPLIARYGAQDRLASAVGDELSTLDWGHFGAFPLPPGLVGPGRADALLSGDTAAQVFRDVRRHAPGALIDVHHPRIGQSMGYFNLALLDPAAAKAGRDGFSWDFDAVEIYNGIEGPEKGRLDDVIADWFSLTAHGHIVTATGNSDTHRLNYTLGGTPRNFVRVADDRPGAVRAADVARALKAHRSYLTTGPLVRLAVGKAEIGDVVRVRGRASVEIEVRAAPWITVSSATVYVNGVAARTFAVPASRATVRLSERVDLDVPRDAAVVARVDGDTPLAPIVGDVGWFPVKPFALTNPIFLDADGNGKFDAPLAAR